jgi:hypothetical protein
LFLFFNIAFFLSLFLLLEDTKNRQFDSISIFVLNPRG